MMIKNVVALDLEVATQARDDFPGNPMRRLLLVPWRPLLTGFTVVVRRLYTHNTGSGKPYKQLSVWPWPLGGLHILTFTWNSNEPPFNKSRGIVLLFPQPAKVIDLCVHVLAR